MDQRGTALITGASSGIGLEITKLFARDGYDVVLIARREDRLNRIKEALEEYYGIDAAVFPCDLAEKDAAERIYSFTKEKGLKIDYLVNNAGFGDHGAFADCDWRKQYDMINVNIIALMQLTRLYLKDMEEEGFGRILNVASAAAYGPGPYMASYYASKAFVKSFSQAIHEEAKEYGVTSTALCLGPATTGFWNAAGFEEDDLTKRMKAASPKDVAKKGYDAMMKGKALCLYGATKALNIGARMAPEAILRKTIKKVNK